MISPLWLIPAFILGGNLGLLTFALLAAADRDAEPRVRDADVEDLERWVAAAKRRRNLA